MPHPSLDYDTEWEFRTRIEYHDFGRMAYRVVYLSEKLRRQLPFDRYPRLRVNAEIAEHPIDGAFQPGQGKVYLILSKAMLKSASLCPGDTVDVPFKIADQEAVDTPDPLRDAFKRNRPAEEAWNELSAGKKRALAHRIMTAKTAVTTERRVKEVVASLTCR